MVQAKNQLVTLLPSVITVPCVLHILNNVTRDILKEKAAADLINGAVALSTFFRSSSRWSTILHEWGTQNKCALTVFILHKNKMILNGRTAAVDFFKRSFL